MSTDHERLLNALSGLDPKPSLEARASDKKRYSELMSDVITQVTAECLRKRGLSGARPFPRGSGVSGAERRMAGGIGDKRVDVTWATEEAGLLLAFSVKCISFPDRRSGNYQKNFTNRRGDMLFEGSRCTVGSLTPRWLDSSSLTKAPDTMGRGAAHRLSRTLTAASGCLRAARTQQAVTSSSRASTWRSYRPARNSRRCRSPESGNPIPN